MTQSVPGQEVPGQEPPRREWWLSWRNDFDAADWAVGFTLQRETWGQRLVFVLSFLVAGYGFQLEYA